MHELLAKVGKQQAGLLISYTDIGGIYTDVAKEMHSFFPNGSQSAQTLHIALHYYSILQLDV